MRLFHTALFAEAKPIIDYYALNKEPQNSKFQIFSGEKVKLIISGTGPMNAAVATSHLLSTSKSNPENLVINLGVCGAKNENLPLGTPIIAHQLWEHDTGRSFYPDIISSHNLTEGSIETFWQPVKKTSLPHIQADYVDMEGSGFYQAAATFYPPHHIYICKVISDFLNGGQLTSNTIRDFVTQALPAFLAFLEDVESLLIPTGISLDKWEQHYLSAIAQRLRLSVTMRHELNRLAKQYKIANQQEAQPLSFLSECHSIEVSSKQEGKIHYAQLKQKLIHA